MIKKFQEIYPSSNVPQETIDAYDWMLADELPARINSVGATVPIAEASTYLRELRGVIDDRPTMQLDTSDGPITVEDFAVARHPEGSEQKLGFFVLLPRE